MMVGGWLLAVGIGIRVGRFKQKKMGLFLGLVWFGFDPVGCSLDRTG